MQMVLRYFRGHRDRPVDCLERVPDTTAQHLRCGQLAQRDLVLRVGLERASDDIGRLVELPGAQQQLAGVQRILPIAGRQGQGA